MPTNILSFLFALWMLYLPASSIVAETARCAECGMMVEQTSPFSASLAQEGKRLDFCDIGDLLIYLNKKSIDPALAQVRDYKTGGPVSADKAFYVRAEKTFRTPMGWGIAAFKSKDDAISYGAAMDITAALKAVQ